MIIFKREVHMSKVNERGGSDIEATATQMLGSELRKTCRLFEKRSQ